MSPNQGWGLTDEDVSDPNPNSGADTDFSKQNSDDAVFIQLMDLGRWRGLAANV